MEKEKLESLLIDYIDSNLNDADRVMVEKELAQNAEAVKLHAQLKEVMSLMDNAHHVEPSFSLRTSFEKSLREEICARGETSSKTCKQVYFNSLLLQVYLFFLLT